jgi:hypothetical protein
MQKGNIRLVGWLVGWLLVTGKQEVQYYFMSFTSLMLFEEFVENLTIPMIAPIHETLTLTSNSLILHHSFRSLQAAHPGVDHDDPDSSVAASSMYVATDTDNSSHTAA